jgi:formate hydrogenlyase subunit 3/multisubunit Na+/H+ antiporter MnhD subunit
MINYLNLLNRAKKPIICLIIFIISVLIIWGLVEFTFKYENKKSGSILAIQVIGFLVSILSAIFSIVFCVYYIKYANAR